MQNSIDRKSMTAPFQDMSPGKDDQIQKSVEKIQPRESKRIDQVRSKFNQTAVPDSRRASSDLKNMRQSG